MNLIVHAFFIMNIFLLIYLIIAAIIAFSWVFFAPHDVTGSPDDLLKMFVGIGFGLFWPIVIIGVIISILGNK